MVSLQALGFRMLLECLQSARRVSADLPIIMCRAVHADVAHTQALNAPPLKP